MRRALSLSLVAGGLACSGPVVQERVYEVEPSALQRIAVAPFQTGPSLRELETPAQELGVLPGPPGAPPSPHAPPGPAPAPDAQRAPSDDAPAPGADAPVAPSDAAALVTRFVSEEFAAGGFEIVPADDLARAFEAVGHEVPHGDRLALARVAASEFGATALLLGRVDRYREREGGELGSLRPASVGFELVLVQAPGGRKLWSATFDHTQRALSEDVFRASRLPGAGSRWLSAAELARWGAGEAAAHLLELRGAPSADAAPA